MLFDALASLWRDTAPAERMAMALGVAYVLLMIGQHRAAWLVGGASTAIYLFVFARAGLYMQATLQLFYVVVSVYGWWAWRGEAGAPALAVTRAGPRLTLAGLGGVALATLATSTWLATETHAANPYLDSLTTWASVFTTWLAARKKIDNWPWWLVIDALIAVLCWQQRLYATMVLYVLYVGLVVIGWRSWFKDMKLAARASAAGVAP